MCASSGARVMRTVAAWPERMAKQTPTGSRRTSLGSTLKACCRRALPSPGARPWACLALGSLDRRGAATLSVFPPLGGWCGQVGAVVLWDAGLHDRAGAGDLDDLLRQGARVQQEGVGGADDSRRGLGAAHAFPHLRGGDGGAPDPACALDDVARLVPACAIAENS